mmetsp:Transcript_51764/g.166653  ORF Transcript_51764/g.166653 Transcript_51764/m.166653 type:complete len:96 (-) Transcript_51764:45-332(-)
MPQGLLGKSTFRNLMRASEKWMLVPADAGGARQPYLKPLFPDTERRRERFNDCFKLLVWGSVAQLLNFALHRYIAVGTVRNGDLRGSVVHLCMFQ